MSESLPTPITAQKLRAALAEARADVLTALEQGKALALSEVAELRTLVDETLDAYSQLLASTPEDKRAEVEHFLGRQAIDLRRAVGMLPQMVSGTAVALSPDKVPGGGQPFIETRAPPRSMSGGEAQRARGKKEVRPGDEVEAWCGPCDGLRSHHVIAMVGGQPKQVICQSCNGRHGFRLTPARVKPKEGAPQRPSIQYKAKKTEEQRQEERRQQDLQRLKDELSVAENVQPFDPRRRYKAGQIIDHPEHGRGKIENTLRSSILVRFTSGLRSLTLK